MTYEMSSDNVLGTLIHDTTLPNVLALYDLNILEKDMQPRYQRLQSNVKKFLDDKSRA